MATVLSLRVAARKISLRRIVLRIRRVGVGVMINGDVAQLGERQLCKLDVDGSSPFVSTLLRPRTVTDSGRLLLAFASIPPFRPIWLHLYFVSEAIIFVNSVCIKQYK